MKRNEPVTKSPDLTKVLTLEHKNKWVVLSHDYKKVLSVGDTLDGVIKAVPDKNTVVINTRPLFISYAPLISPAK